MNTRERFNAICNFELKGDPFFYSVAAWPQTIDRWYDEGMPVKSIETMKEVNMHFLGYDHQVEAIYPRGSLRGFGRYGQDPWIVAIDPPFERKVVGEDDNYLILTDYDGTLVRRKKDRDDSIPQYYKYPIETREDWLEYKKRLDPNSPGRWLEGWDKILDKWLAFPVKKELEGKPWSDRDFPLGMNALSLYGNLRNYMGMENLSIAIYEEPELVMEMMDHQLYVAMEMLKKVYDAGVTLDYVFIWEDMCYNAGPMVSPKWVKEFMVPRYKQFTGYLRDHGCNCIAVDSDGDIEELIPLWIESGINATFPLERAAGVDAMSIRKRYGENMIMFGNVDKRAIAKGKSEIDKEVEFVREMTNTGGYFVNLDHFVPPDVSYENMKYFVDEVLKYRKV